MTKDNEFKSVVSYEIFIDNNSPTERAIRTVYSDTEHIVYMQLDYYTTSESTCYFGNVDFSQNRMYLKEFEYFPYTAGG